MLILDKPYVSEFLQKTAEDMHIPVLDNGHIFELIQNRHLNLLKEDEFLNMAGTRNLSALEWRGKIDKAN